MGSPRRVVVVESASPCADALRGPAFDVVVFEKAADAYRAIAEGGAAAAVVHVEESADFEDRVALVRRLQQEEATRKLPILVVITQRPNRPSAMTAQRYGSAVVKLTTAECTGLAETLADLMWEVG